MNTRAQSWIGGIAIIALVLLVIGGGILWWTHQDIKEGHVGVEVYKSAATGDVYEPGWAFINPVTTNIVPISTRPEVANFRGNNNITVITDDGQDVYVDVTVRYRVNNTTAVTFFKEYKDHGQAQKRVIHPTVRSEMRDQASDVDVLTVISKSGREQLAIAVAQSLRKNFDGTGLVLEAVQIRDVQPNPEYSKQLENIEIENAKAEQKLIKANATRKAEIIEARGDAKAASIRDRELTDKVLMDKYINAVNNADTVIVSTDRNGTPVILNGQNATRP